MASADYNEHALMSHLSLLLSAKARPFSVSGLIPLDPTNLVVFFRSKSGITHSLDFPIDVDYDLPPALDVLMAACRPHVGELDEYGQAYPASTKESLFYPPNLPLSATLEIANHPILDAVRNTLFSALPAGHYLTAVRDRLEIVPKGGRITPQPKPVDNRVATIIVTLPVRYRGGALVIRDVDDSEETYHGGGKSGTSGHSHSAIGVGYLEWTAFLSNCDYEVEEVTKGCRLTISYSVFLRTFGPSGIQPDPLITPSDRFLDLLAPILNVCRGRQIAFYLAGEYGANPAEALAESLVPHLGGADSLLYHAMKLYKLAPELHWAAGGYIWPVDRIVECSDDIDIPRPMPAIGLSSPDGVYRSPLVHGGGIIAPALGLGPELAAMTQVEERDNLRWRVENSGAIPLAEADIMVLGADPVNTPGAPITKERVPFVSGGQLDKLVVNVLLVAYVP